MDLGLAGKVAIVTGSSRGIGLSIARQLAEEGAKVTLVSRKADQLDAAKHSLAGPGPHIAIAADVTSAADCERVVEETVKAQGTVDLLVNNVGGSGARNFKDADEQDFNAVFGRNLWPSLRMSRLCLPYLQRGSAVVMVASIYGREAGGGASYNVAKAAEISLAKAMARDLARDGIRVNSVAPGSILFPGSAWERVQESDPERYGQVLNHEIPAGRFGRPEEVAAVVAFMLSEQASWLTGACVPVDGAQGRAF